MSNLLNPTNTTLPEDHGGEDLPGGRGITAPIDTVLNSFLLNKIFNTSHGSTTTGDERPEDVDAPTTNSSEQALIKKF